MRQSYELQQDGNGFGKRRSGGGSAPAGAGAGRGVVHTRQHDTDRHGENQR